MSDTVGDNDASNITYFARHPEELLDEAAASTSSGVFGNFFSRIFKSTRETGPVQPDLPATTTMVAMSASGSQEFPEQSCPDVQPELRSQGVITPRFFLYFFDFQLSLSSLFFLVIRLFLYSLLTYSMLCATLVSVLYSLSLP
ncbi:unnamed protein product [Gongylonema pulchrum]|uniref:Transmembrane protein n=1 Tax=Gongylonema pulchrum TaxID=637853 RepID=A0A183EW05_9BILA|nr:unnamed protein product [Gongylonema pulchrum]